eukprot:2594461-Pleurochrysis_carterae.AAC.1
MAEKLSHVIRRISELAGTLLDVKVTMLHATGRLASTVAAIRDVLAELEAREQKSAFDSGTRGRAFDAQSGTQATVRKQGDKPHKRSDRDPKRVGRPNTFDREWSAQFGPCRHCGGKHWHRDCPRRRTKAENKSSAVDNRVLAASVENHEDNASAALFARAGGATLTFDVPAEGRALCARDVELSENVASSPPANAHDHRWSPTPSELEIQAQDEAELDEAERRAARSETSDSDFDPDRPYS